MKTFGILIGAALGLIAWTAPGNMSAFAGTISIGGNNATCQGVHISLQSNRNNCRNKARKKTGAERKEHFDWCKRQWKNAVAFHNKCAKFSSQCYKGRVNWRFEFYDYLTLYRGGDNYGSPSYDCASAPAGWKPPGKAQSQSVKPLFPEQKQWDDPTWKSSPGFGIPPGGMSPEMKQACEQLRTVLKKEENPRDKQLKQVINQGRQMYQQLCK